jgi:hypothetical protein
MLKNATVLLIRHAEKPGDLAIDRIEDGTFLTQAGRERALAYVAFFEPHSITGVQGKGAPYPFEPDALFAARDSKASHRPRLTLEPVAVATGLDLNCDYEDSDHKGVVKAIEETKAQKILVCWHHGTIIQLAKMLLAVDGHLPKLPSASLWPKKWPPEVFGWVLQIRYDGAGKPMIDWTKCSNQKMMFDDTIEPKADGFLSGARSHGPGGKPTAGRASRSWRAATGSTGSGRAPTA